MDAAPSQAEGKGVPSIEGLSVEVSLMVEAAKAVQQHVVAMVAAEAHAGGQKAKRTGK